MADESGNITQLISRYREGDNDVLNQLATLVYQRMHRIASRQLQGQAGHTLSPTGLVNEAFLRLFGKGPLDINDRKHFFAVAAQCMRWVLMNHARRKRQVKHGGGQARVSLEDHEPGQADAGYDALELANLLEQLADNDPRLSLVVQLRYLVGLDIEETAQFLGVSVSTVKRDWELAKAWLGSQLEKLAA